MDFPRYYLLGPRPVKAVGREDGGVSLSKLDMQTGRFVDGMDVAARVLSEKEDVDRLTEDQFITEVETVRSRFPHPDGPLNALYQLIRAAVAPAELEGRALTSDEFAFVSAIARQTHARFEALLTAVP